MDTVQKQIVKGFSDHRGWVFEPLTAEMIARQKNVHVVVNRPGAVRGNHYHLSGTETLIVCGPALIRIRQGLQVEDLPIPADETVRVVIPPGISHAIQNTGKSDGLLVAFNTSPHDPAHPDTVQDLLIGAD